MKTSARFRLIACYYLNEARLARIEAMACRHGDNPLVNIMEGKPYGPVYVTASRFWQIEACCYIAKVRMSLSDAIAAEKAGD